MLCSHFTEYNVRVFKVELQSSEGIVYLAVQIKCVAVIVTEQELLLFSSVILYAFFPAIYVRNSFCVPHKSTWL